MTFPPPQYPPKFDEKVEEKLVRKAIDYALANGLILRSITNPTHSATHAPFTLLPSPFPKQSLHATAAIQPAINHLMHMLASDHSFITSVFEEYVTLCT
jgi:glutathione synthase